MSFEPITMTLASADVPLARRRLLQVCSRIGEALLSGLDLVIEVYDGRTRAQERLYHSIFRDFSRQLDAPMVGKTDEASWKRLMVDAFYRATKDDPELRQEWLGRVPRVLPNIDGTGFVTVEITTTKFTKALARNFITFMHAWGDEQGVRWSRTSLGRDWPEEATA